MSYGRDKVRDMTRSILPSCAGKGAKDELRRIKKAGRKRVAAQLHDLRGERGVVEDGFWDSEADLDYYPYRSIKYAVRDRRDADKIGPILRWATAKTAHLPQQERLEHLTRFIGRDTLAERHAWTHLETASDLRDNKVYYGFLSTNPYYGERLDREVLREAITVAVNYRHGDLNRMLKEDHTRPSRAYRVSYEPCREDHVIRGIGEVDAFVDALRLRDPFCSPYTSWDAEANLVCGLSVLPILDRLEIPWT
jgi:hypothetical protein